ncbi:MAG: hypothetical protein RLZZ40_618, partial [Actinomycetota bacterium]
MRALRALQKLTESTRTSVGSGILKATSASLAATIFLFATGVFLTAEFLAAPAADAAATAAINVGATSVRVGQSNNLGISLTGFSADEQAQTYQVTLKYVNGDGVEQNNGTLSADSTKGGTLITGYSSWSAAKIGFKGTYTQINNTLQTVSWTPSSSVSGLTLRIGLSVQPGTGKSYDANTGHYYEYVASGKSWTAAKADAASRTLFGLTGYLAHITNRAENDFVASETGASNIWIGATDAAVEGQWRWSGATITGESDFVFGTYSNSNGTTNSATPSSTASGWGVNSWYSGRYAGWSSGEPNNWGGNEDCAVTNWGSSGQWNDLDCTGSNAYLVEYGGAGGTFTGLNITKDATMGASNAQATWTSPSSPTTSSTQEFGISFNNDISGLGADDFVNLGTATGCTFSPAASSATASTSVAVTVSNCSSGTLQPKFLENSVTVAGGIVIPAATASSITINAGAVSSSSSTVSTNRSNVVIVTQSATITVTPKDAIGRLLGTGKTVVITSTRGTVGTVTEHADGTYTASVTSGTTGSATVSASVGGTNLDTTINLEFGTTPSFSDGSITADGSLGIEYSSEVAASGTPTPTYSIYSGALPEGLTLNPDTGAITGTPIGYGIFHFVVRATNSMGSADTTNLALHIYSAPTYRSSANLPTSVQKNGAYEGNVTFYGSVTSWGIVPSGITETATVHDSLPAGLSINPDTGLITGYATVPGTYRFVVRAYYPDPTSYGDSSIRTIEVRESPSWSDSSIATSGQYAIAYSDGVLANGYPAPQYTWSGDTPSGLNLDVDTGAITGTPTEAG